jgi:isoquinoline 1-oxidoreductase beta subunit
MKRRRFVLAGLGAVGVVGAFGIGWSLLPPRSRLRGQSLDPSAAGPALNGWVRIGADDTVTVILAKSEMGQGIHTSLAQILADELDADWSQVRLESAGVDGIYNNVASIVDLLPFHPESDGVIKRVSEHYTRKLMPIAGFQVTGGSSSIKDLWLPMRTAGASARAMLVSAAAAAWGVPESEISVASGRISHPSGRSSGFGALAEAAAALPLVEEPVLKSPAQFTLIGQPVPRTDRRAKQSGTATFGIDVVLPGMRYASVAMNPSLGGGVASFDIGPLREMAPSLTAFVVDGFNGGTGGVAFVADAPWHALRATREATIEWTPGPLAGASSDDLIASLRTAVAEKSGSAYFKRGDVADALAESARRIVATYSAPYLAHLALEPVNCTVLVEKDKATVWASTQAPNIARLAVAKVLDLPTEAVDIRVQLIGGGFGRRLDVDFIAQAAAVAKESPGVPVQTFWSREEDTRHDFYRPACVATLEAGLDADGALTAWKHLSASQSINQQGLRRYLGVPTVGPDKVMIEGAFDQSYEWPAARIAHVKVKSPFPVGWWRSVGHSHQAFFKESFLDEVAHAAGTDPIALRLSLLKEHPRQAAVLLRAAELAGWGTPMAAPNGVRVARGVALHQSYGSTVAEIAEVEIDIANAIRVRRVIAVVDCGYVVNPGFVRQQIEGGVIFGLSAAFGNAVTMVDGKVVQSNFHDVPVMRMSATPKIDVEIIRSDAPPEGVGETAVPPIAPAVANAIFAATGVRLRDLPLRLPTPTPGAR